MRVSRLSQADRCSTLLQHRVDVVRMQLPPCCLIVKGLDVRLMVCMTSYCGAIWKILVGHECGHVYTPQRLGSCLLEMRIKDHSSMFALPI